MKTITFLRNLIVLVALLVGSGSVMGQGTEDFTNLPTTSASSYLSRSWNGTDGVTWTAEGARTDQTLTGKAICWGNSGTRNVISPSYTGGMGTLTFKYVRAFTGTSARSIEVYVNSVKIGETITVSPTSDVVVTYTADINVSGNVVLEIRSTGAAQVKVDDISWTGYTSGTPTVATPTFNPVAGTYYTTQNVTISTETEGATIRYTTNGDEPTESSAIFSTPINVSSTTTIKAKAFKAEMDPSATATATYTLPIEVANIAALRAGTTGGTIYKLTGEAVMTLKSANRNVKYIQDATAGILIDDPTGIITTPYNVNDGITGIIGTLGVYAGMLQFAPLVDPGIANSTGNIVTPVEVDLSEIGNYEAQLVKVSGVIINGEGDFVVSRDYNLNGGSNPIIRTQYGDLDYIGTAIPSVPQDIVGVVLKYNTTNQLVPRSLAEMTNTTSPTIIVTESSVSPMNAQIETTDDATITVNGANLTGNIVLAVTGTDASLFTLSTYSIAPTEGVVSDVTVTITYAPLEAGSHSALLTLSSAGAEDVTRSLSGTATDPPGPITVPNVIISEVYGGGGNAGAQYKNDFVELYNTTDLPVDISNWSVQYYSATGTSAGVISIPSGKTINPYGYFLLAGAGGATGADLPTPDATNTGVNISSTNGKVVLYTTSTAQGLANSTTLTLITENPYFKDYVPFGSATPVWGTPLGALSNTTSAKRKKVDNVFIYTQDIGADFEIGAPDPQNFGFTSKTHNPSLTSIFAHNAQIRFSAVAGESVEVYNAVGQKLISTRATDGQNVLNISEKGVMIVKVGERIAKVIL